MKPFFLLLLVISAFITITKPVTAQKAKAEAGIQTIMQQNKVIGLSVAVVKKGKLIYTHSFGLKDIESNTALTDDCLFRIASISKTFSATAIMQLAEAKKLSLDDDVSKLVGFSVRNPNFPEAVITLRMLLAHRSGINDSQGYFTLDAINPAKNPDWAKCYNNYAPGADYEYCNLNYNMVGTIIEKISGERFDQYIKQHILQPLGLNAGYCVDSLDNSRFATLYEYNSKENKFTPSPAAYAPRREEIANYRMGYSTPIFSPTGGMKISATDLATYMTMHMQLGRYKKTRIISKKHAREMQTKLSEKDGYGLGIITLENIIPKTILKGHDGIAYGLFSAMFFNPKEQYGFVVITNGCDGRFTDGINTVMHATINCLYDSFIATGK